jgi:hypothetical protein
VKIVDKLPQQQAISQHNRKENVKYSIDVGIYELELARSVDVEYLNICHEQFVEQMNIRVAKICKILVTKIEILADHAEYGERGITRQDLLFLL